MSFVLMYIYKFVNVSHKLDILNKCASYLSNTSSRKYDMNDQSKHLKMQLKILYLERVLFKKCTH